MNTIHHWIGGTTYQGEAKRRAPVWNPTTGEQQAQVALASAVDVEGEYSDQISTNVDLFSFREPLGVVASITPFDFPAMVPM